MRKLLFAVALSAPAFIASAAHAGGYNIPDENARTLGLSQADLADQTGAEAILINPAGMAGQIGLDISGSFEWLDNRTEWDGADGQSAKLLSHFNSPPAAAISFGDKLCNDMMWAIGVGFDVPAGGALHWPQGWPGQEYIQSVDQKVYQMVAGGAFQPLPYLSLGAAYVRYQGTEELHQEINFIDHYGDAGLGMSGGANTFLLSAQGKLPWFPLQLAVSFKYKGSTQINGNVHFTDVPPAFSTTLQDQSVSEELSLPSELHAGASYEVYKNLNLMFTFTQEFWSIYHSDTFVGSTGFTVNVPRDYNDTQVYRLGAEWKNTPFAPWLTLRLGALRSISPQPTDTVSPSLTDGDSTAFSVGAGFEVTPDLRFDVGYQHAIFDNVTASGTETLAGTYKTQVDLVSVGINWRFDILDRAKSGAIAQPQ